MNCYQYENKKYLPFERSLYGKKGKPSVRSFETQSWRFPGGKADDGNYLLLKN